MGEHKRKTKKPEMLGDAPIEPVVYQTMNALGRSLDEMLNGPRPPAPMKYKKTWGFVLMCFPFDDGPGRCNYISNADRKDVITLLKEQISRFEGMPEASGKG